MPSTVEASLRRLAACAERRAAEVDIEADGSGVSITHRSLNLRFHHSLFEGAMARRARQGGQALLKACRNRQRSIRRVLDTTAGWGADGLTLAWHGQMVTALEREPLVHAILDYSLALMKTNPEYAEVAARLTLEQVNAADYLRALPRDHAFDCILLDPMFPSHKSGAKAGKEMQILQALTGNQDIEACFALAMHKALNRVVVKRPLKAPAISAQQPDLCYRQKTIRFDVYLTG